MTLTDSQLQSVVISFGPMKAAPTGADRRREPRTAFQGQATIIPCDCGSGRTPETVMMRDVSASGVGFQHDRPLPKGQRFILVLPPGMRNLAKGVLCTVAYSRAAAGGLFDIGASLTALVQPTDAPSATPAPASPTSPAPALPVPQLIQAFREQLKGVLSEADLAMIRSIEGRASKATAPVEALPPGARPAVAAKPAAPAPVPPRNPRDVRQILTRDECLKRAEQAMQARTLSGVIAQVISLAASPRSDLSDVASLVVRDPILSARILQAANSVSYTSTRGVVSSIPDAVRNIGCAAVRDIAATLGVFDAMPPSEADGFNPIRCWQHSFAVATLCQRLAPEDVKGPAYLVGLCHDLGEILFHSHFGAEYEQVMEAQAATGKRRDELERTMLGMSHGELVATILRCLGLPDVVRSPIDEYHANGTAGRALANPLARLLRLADLYANGVLLASSGQSPINPLTRPECRLACGQDHPAPQDGVPLRGEVFALTAMLARMSAKDEAQLMAPLYPRRPVRVWLARDPSLSSFDPIAAALESLAEVSVRDGLPASDDLAGHAGVVVVSRSTSAAGFTAPEIAKAVGDSVPVLWLTGRVDGAASGGASGLVPTLWPTPLSRLAEFIAGLK